MEEPRTIIAWEALQGRSIEQAFSIATGILTNGGDGFESAVDPENSNIVYAQSQYGVLVRHDKQSGERINIQPQPGQGEPGLRYNWDAPLIVSPHASTRDLFRGKYPLSKR